MNDKAKQIVEELRNIPDYPEQDYVPSPTVGKRMADLSAELGELLDFDETKILKVAKDLSKTAKNRWIRLGMENIIWESRTLEEICE